MHDLHGGQNIFIFGMMYMVIKNVFINNITPDKVVESHTSVTPLDKQGQFKDNVILIVHMHLSFVSQFMLVVQSLPA